MYGFFSYDASLEHRSQERLTLKVEFLQISCPMSNLTVSRQDVLRVVFATIDEINETQPEEQKLSKLPETYLFGQQGRFDSLGLVNFIVLLEQSIADEFGAAITLADEKALSREKSPFLTVESLTDYILEQLEGLKQ
ncbi:MAG: hypothetical protein H0T63_07320 [Pyrinomonadaceae bacterium]|nr:hypothetical protein [Pyrinomonadaceae bacterium]